MATPEPIRRPEVRLSRVAARVGLGHGQGVTAGVNRVPVDDSADRDQGTA